MNVPAVVFLSGEMETATQMEMGFFTWVRVGMNVAMNYSYFTKSFRVMNVEK